MEQNALWSLSGAGYTCIRDIMVIFDDCHMHTTNVSYIDPLSIVVLYIV